MIYSALFIADARVLLIERIAVMLRVEPYMLLKCLNHVFLPDCNLKLLLYFNFACQTLLCVQTMCEITFYDVQFICVTKVAKLCFFMLRRDLSEEYSKNELQFSHISAPVGQKPDRKASFPSYWVVLQSCPILLNYSVTWWSPVLSNIPQLPICLLNIFECSES